MKPAVAFIAAFVLATAAATGVNAKLHPAPKPPPAPADSTARADSTESDSTSADSTSSTVDADSTLSSRIVDTAHVLSISPIGAASRAIPGAQTRAAAGSAAGGTPAAARPITVPTLPVAGAPRTVPVSDSTSPDTASQHHLAKLFASMQPKEAAQVLQRLGDDDVQIILGYVGTRQAAAILAELPPDRVAAFSKLAMRGGTGGRVK